MHIERTVEAELVERFIFNFRLLPTALAEKLPVSWLEPQVINGWSVVSFCILSLERVTLAPLPGAFGHKTISCAYRCGVIDGSTRQAEPSVYVIDRSSDLQLISRLGNLVFASAISNVDVALKPRTGESAAIRVLDRNGGCIFDALVRQSPRATLASKVFASLDDCSTFIRLGVSSYAPSVCGRRLAKVDLHKEDTGYEPVIAKIGEDRLGALWPEAGLEFDSAIRTHGGKYRWTYRGRRPTEPQGGRLRASRLPRPGRAKNAYGPRPAESTSATGKTWPAARI
jgi:hypothetical protein